MEGSFFKLVLTIIALFVFVFYHWVTGNSQKQVDEQFMFVEGRPHLSYDFFTSITLKGTKGAIDSSIAMYENYADSGIYLLKFRDSQVKENHEHFLIKEHTERDSIGYKEWRKDFETTYFFKDYRCFTIEGSNRYFNVSWTYFDSVKMYPLDYLNEENILKIRNQLTRLLPNEVIKLKVLKKNGEDSLSLAPIQVYEIYDQENNLILHDDWSIDQLKTSSKRHGFMDYEEVAHPEFFLWYEPFFFKIGVFFIGFLIVVTFFSWLYMLTRKAVFAIEILDSNDSLKWSIRKRSKYYGPFEIPIEDLLVIIYSNTEEFNKEIAGIEPKIFGIVFNNKVTDKYYHMIAHDYYIDPILLEQLSELPDECLTLLKAEDVIESASSEGEWTHSYVIEGQDDHVYHSTYFR